MESTYNFMGEESLKYTFDTPVHLVWGFFLLNGICFRHNDCKNKLGGTVNEDRKTCFREVFR